MSMDSITELFLTWVITYGEPALALTLFLAAFGIPLPATFFVLAAGAFARQGVIDWYIGLPLGLLAAVLGDSLSYSVGRFANGWVQKRFGDSPSWQRAQETLEQRGGQAIYLTRFLLTPLALPTNLIAGGSGYSFLRFLFYDVAGEATWLLIYGGIGYIFASQWEMLSDLISDFSGLLVGVAFFGGGIYLLIRRQHQHKMVANIA